MVEQISPGIFPGNEQAARLRDSDISRAASLGTLGCIAVAVTGMLGQGIAADAFPFMIVTALGLAGLASIVFAHQR